MLQRRVGHDTVTELNTRGYLDRRRDAVKAVISKQGERMKVARERLILVTPFVTPYEN